MTMMIIKKYVNESAIDKNHNTRTNIKITEILMVMIGGY